MNKVIPIYESILRYTGLISDEKGFITTNIVGRKDPSTLDGKAMVLPVSYQLKSFNPEEKIVFHPLYENILRGESQVLTKLKEDINIRLNYSIGVIAHSLLTLVASPGLHGKLNSDQSDILISISDADEKTANTFLNLMLSGVKSKPDRLFTNIYLKRGGSVKGERCSRVGVVSFPFYEDLMNDKIDKLRVKDKEAFKQIFKFMLPDLDAPEAYNYGSKTNVAPYLDALMMSSLKITSKLNDLVETFGEYIDEAETFKFDSDWVEAFNDLEALSLDIRRIPIQQGNDGSISVIEQKEEQAQAAPVPAPYQPQPQQVQQQAPQYQPQPVYQQPQPTYMPVPQQPTLKVTDKGLDWRSLAATNPSVAVHNQMNPLANQINRQNMQQMQPQMQQPMLPPGMMMYPNGQVGPIPQNMMQQPMMQQMQPQMQQPMLPPGMMVYPNGQVGPIPQNMMQPTGFGYR